MVRRNGKRKNDGVSQNVGMDEEMPMPTLETKQNEVKKFETVVLFPVGPVQRLAYTNNLDYAASKPNSLPKSLTSNSTQKIFQTYPIPKMSSYLYGSMKVVCVLGCGLGVLLLQVLMSSTMVLTMRKMKVEEI